ncbi:MAG TPA: sigma-70 family RNA polymerase sigma factor, partial [Gemmataceae bacterium]
MTRPNLPVAATAREVIRASADLRGEGPTDGELLRRYAEARDEAAFAALVHRHAGLVLGVCRRLLGDAHDAEDACQATFLVLARKAGSVNWQPSVANWLYRTARQIAANARVAARRRARREGRSAVPEQVPAVDAMPVREVLEVFEEELARLPARYRGPLILCCLEGLARDEAARQLGVPPATLKGQLGRARERLRVALARRGITLGAALVAAAATSPAGAGSPRLVRAVLAAAGGEAPPAVAALAAGAAGGSVSKVGVVLVMLSVGMLGGALASGRSAATDPPAPDSAEKPVAAAPADAGPRADRYGDPLPPGALMRLGTVRFRHGGQLHAIAYSADGKTIASGGFGTGRIMLWEAATGKPIATLEREQPAGQGYVFDLAFSPDGKWLVSVGSRTTDHESVGEVVFWDLSTRTCGEVIPTIAGTRNRWARAVAISPDGKTVAAGTDSGTLLLLDAKTRRVRELIEKVDTSIAGLAFSRDGKSLAVGGYRGAFLFDPTTGRETGRLETGEITRAVAFA